MRIDRRRFLRGALAAAALPALELSSPARARAATGIAPKRLVIVHHPQGTVLSQHVPSGTERAFEPGSILEPLRPFLDRAVVLSGLDNVASWRNSVGNAHQNANLTLWTGMPFLRQEPAAITAGGPSVEQVIAGRIGAGCPFPRIDLCAGGSSRNGVVTPSDGYFWYGAGDPVAFYNDPLVALLRIFGDQTVRPEDAWALRARRGAVLAGVMDGFAALRGQVGYADRLRLEAHLSKVESLEARIRAGVGTCTPPSLEIPTGLDASVEDDVTTPLYNELLVSALACDLTRVGTFHFANGHAPTFPWLWAENGGPIVPAEFENWHAMVHADYQPGMERVYRWYMEMLADLLGRMAVTTDSDGDNLLDTTLVVCMSEYSSGRHVTRSIPALLIGHTGPFAPGRWIDHMPAAPEDFNGWTDSGVSTSQLLVSLLHAFGFDDARFGLEDPDISEGGVPGL
jgi:hypothetical protein